MRDDDGEVAEERVVDLRGGASGEAQDGGGGEEAGKEGEEEVEAQLRGAADQIIVEEGAPGVFDDDADGDAEKVPEGTEGRTGD